MEEFSESLVRLMAKKSLSQAELSRISGVRASAISTYVNDTSEPSLANARKIADALGVTIDAMVGIDFEDEGDPRLRHICDCYDGMDETGREGLKDQAEWLYRKHPKKDGELQVAQHRYA